MQAVEASKIKKLIRGDILAARKRLSPETSSLASLAILEAVCALGVLEAHESFHLYFPINNEVDTRPLFYRLRERHKTVVMPRTNFQAPGLTNYMVESLERLEETVFNMREPREDSRPWPGDCDVIFVPGVAFAADGARLGYGGGFYDRFLAGSAALKIALAFDLQLTPSLPALEHDVKMDIIITEKRILHCRQGAKT